MPALDPTLIPFQGTGKRGAADYSFASLHELAWDPNSTTVDQPLFRQDVYNKLFRLYGDGIRLTTMLYAAGLVLDPWTSSRYTCNEEPSFERMIEIGSTMAESGKGAGDTLTLNVASDDRDYRILGMSIYLGGEFFNDAASTTPKEFFVSAYDASTGNATLQPYTGTTEQTADIPSGTLFKVGPAKYGRGGGQPESMVSTLLQRDFYTTMVGETFEMDGGVNTFDPQIGVLDTNGSKTLWAKGLAEMEFRMERAKDAAILISEINTNQNNVKTDRRGGSTTSPVQSFQGVRNHLDEAAQPLHHQGGIEPQDTKLINQIAESQGVMADTWFMGVGPRLYEQMQDAGFEFVKEFSGGTDMYKNLNDLGGNVKVIDMYGTKVMLSKMATYADRNSFGNPAYAFPEEGFMAPLAHHNVTHEVSGNKERLSLPNLGLAYRKGNGEDRTNMFGQIAGVNGLGYPFIDQYDSSSFHMKTEFGIVMLGRNQFINILKA